MPNTGRVPAQLKGYYHHQHQRPCVVIHLARLKTDSCAKHTLFAIPLEKEFHGALQAVSGKVYACNGQPRYFNKSELVY